MSTIYQRHLPKVFLWPEGKKGEKLDISRYVTGFNTDKAIQQPMGKWTLNLLPAGTRIGGGHRVTRVPDLISRVQTNGVVSIGMDRPGGVMFGLIDNASLTRNLAGPRATQTQTIMGSDFGKTLARDQIVHSFLTVQEYPAFISKLLASVSPKHTLLDAVKGVWGPLSRENIETFTGATVEDVVRWLLEVAPSMQIPLLANLGGKGLPGEYITINQITSWNDGRIYSEAPHDNQGTILDFLRSVLDNDFYEFFLDSRSLSFGPFGSEIPQIDLIIRPKPFDEPGLNFLPTRESTGLTWNTLKTRITNESHHEIRTHQIFSENLGFTDNDVFAMHIAFSRNDLFGNPDALAEGLYYPAVDTFQLARTGLRKFQSNISLLSPDLFLKQKGEVDRDRALEIGYEVAEFRNRAFNWYRMNNYMDAGTVVVAGKDDYRAGDPFFFPEHTPKAIPARYLPQKGVRYYCTGVSHSWSIGQPYTTQLRLMRGHNEDSIRAFKAEVLADAPAANPANLAAVAPH